MWWKQIPSFLITIGCLGIPGIFCDRVFRFLKYGDKSIAREIPTSEDFYMSYRDMFIMNSRYKTRGLDFIPEVD